MRLVAVSVVKNEADIIEAFVRHTLGWVDHHLVFDHESTDGTRAILAALQAEGLPLSVFADDHPGHIQQARSNYLTRLAATEYGADWIFPLDADEFLIGPDRAALEHELQSSTDAQPTSLPLLDYCTTAEDVTSVLNPVLRLRYCRPLASNTRKVFVPRRLALDPAVVAGKGSHALYQGAAPLPAGVLSPAYYLAHPAMRSPEHQVLRLVRAELQRHSRGQAAAGLDVHYRLGFQLLADNPENFLTIITPHPDGLRLLPITYRGGPLRYTVPNGWTRVVRSLLPYLEELATGHGRLADATGVDVADPEPVGLRIRNISPAGPAMNSVLGDPTTFSGFVAIAGWGDEEGPVPEAFLPRFHWGYAPSTELAVKTDRAGTVRMFAEALTYSDRQTLRIELNGTPVHSHDFSRINQKELIATPLNLRAGDNRLILHYSRKLTTEYDTRKLAVIFLSLHIGPNT